MTVPSTVPAAVATVRSGRRVMCHRYHSALGLKLLACPARATPRRLR